MAGGGQYEAPFDQGGSEGGHPHTDVNLMSAFCGVLRHDTWQSDTKYRN